MEYYDVFEKRIHLKKDTFSLDEKRSGTKKRNMPLWHVSFTIS